MSKGSNFVVNGIGVSEGRKNYENWAKLDKISTFLFNSVPPLLESAETVDINGMYP